MGWGDDKYSELVVFDAKVAKLRKYMTQRQMAGRLGCGQTKVARACKRLDAVHSVATADGGAGND